MNKDIKAIREILGNNFYPSYERGAKTNELGLTKGQCIQLAYEIAEYFNKSRQNKE